MTILRPEHQLTQQFMAIHTISTIFIKLNLIPKIPILIPWSPKMNYKKVYKFYIQHNIQNNKETCIQQHNSQHLATFHNFLTLTQEHHFQFNFRNHIHIINWKLASPLPEFRWTIYRKWILPLPLLFASSRFSSFFPKLLKRQREEEEGESIFCKSFI